jgi:pimeloyl-ACP methyl ester carboxylesterase
MSDDRQTSAPRFPTDVATSYHDGVLGRMRSRSVGEPHAGVPEVVLVQGLAVADYLLPGLAAFSEWTRAHLIELPGLGGSGEPPHELTVAEYGRAVADWLTARRLGPVVLTGHSSGTQVAAEAAAGNADVAGVVLASPTFDPAARALPRLVIRWLLDGRREAPGLIVSQRPEWTRAGPRRLVHLVRAHRAYVIEEPLARLSMPLLVIRGRDDALSTPKWGANSPLCTRRGVRRSRRRPRLPVAGPARLVGAGTPLRHPTHLTRLPRIASITLNH